MANGSERQHVPVKHFNEEEGAGKDGTSDVCSNYHGRFAFLSRSHTCE